MPIWPRPQAGHGHPSSALSGAQRCSQTLRPGVQHRPARAPLALRSCVWFGGQGLSTQVLKLREPPLSSITSVRLTGYHVQARTKQGTVQDTRFTETQTGKTALLKCFWLREGPALWEV